MTWIMSRYRAGDIVEVRSKEEISGNPGRAGLRRWLALHA